MCLNKHLLIQCNKQIGYLLPENRFGLTTITFLFSVVTTTTLGSTTLLGLFVLRHFVDFVGLAFLAIGATTFWYVHLERDVSRVNTTHTGNIT